MAKRTEEQIRADLIARVAKIDQRAANRKARETSKDVRCIERAISGLCAAQELAVPTDSRALSEAHSTLLDMLEHARAGAAK